jgi:cobalamin biosynthesis Mg chelatase CobN
MDRDGDEIHLTATESSGGVKSQGVRVVLIVSLVLIVVAMSAVWIIASATR